MTRRGFFSFVAGLAAIKLPEPVPANAAAPAVSVTMDAITWRHTVTGVGFQPTGIFISMDSTGPFVSGGDATSEFGWRLRVDAVSPDGAIMCTDCSADLVSGRIRLNE